MINRTLVGFIRKELTQSLRDPRMKFMLFFMPCVQMTLFGVAVSNDVKNIRLAAIYDSKDYIMQHIYDRALSSKWFIPTEVDNLSDPVELIKAGKADAVIIAPPGGVTKGIGRQVAPIQILADSVNVIQGQSVENYLKAITAQVVKDDLNITLPESPIRLDLRVLYNPSLETAIFMVPGVMCTLLVMTTMMLAMVAVVREKEMGTFETLISAPVSRSEVIYGKTIPYVILGMSNVPFTLGVAVFAFNVPMRGHLVVLFLAAFAFVCTCVAMGTLISTFCKNQQQAALASFLFMFPAMMFSGLMFPLENMPTAIKWIAYFDPLAHYMGLLRNIMLKGGGFNYVVTHIAVLAAMAATCTMISFRRFRTTLQ